MRDKLNKPRKARSTYRPDYSGMSTYPEMREVTVTDTETGAEATEVVTVPVPLRREIRRVNGARGERLNGLASLMAGFPQKRAWKRVSAGRTR